MKQLIWYKAVIISKKLGGYCLKMDNGQDSNLEGVIDRILTSANELKRKLENIKDFNPDNDSKYRPDQLSERLKDTQRIKDLERQNIELRQALEDHQYGLEFIMSKYRSQIVELIRLNKIERTS